MGLGVGIFLIAVGAILAFAVHSTSGAVDVHAVGWILMGGECLARNALLAVVGGPGLLVPAPDLRRRRPPGGARGTAVLTVARRPSGRLVVLCPRLASPSQTAIGSSATNLDPPEPLDSTQMRPPIRSSNSRLM